MTLVGCVIQVCVHQCVRVFSLKTISGCQYHLLNAGGQTVRVNLRIKSKYHINLVQRARARARTHTHAQLSPGICYYCSDYFHLTHDD